MHFASLPSDVLVVLRSRRREFRERTRFRIPRFAAEKHEGFTRPHDYWDEGGNILQIVRQGEISQCYLPIVIVPSGRAKARRWH